MWKIYSNEKQTVKSNLSFLVRNNILISSLFDMRPRNILVENVSHGKKAENILRKGGKWREDSMWSINWQTNYLRHDSYAPATQIYK